MKKLTLGLASLFFVLLTIPSAIFVSGAGAFAEGPGRKDAPAVSFLKGAAEAVKRGSGKKGPGGPSIVVSCENPCVVKGKTVQMKASVEGSDAKPEFVWASSDERTATVDQNGLVKGVDFGKSTVSASAEVNGQKLTGVFVINVTRPRTLVRNVLEERQILSYQYSYVDDYYYTNDRDCWQDSFGFGRIYDLAAPYVLMEYDYVRVFFPYGDRDWMVQLWKGQYGLFFYGCEIGVYNKPPGEKKDGVFTMYGRPEQEDWPKMEITLYHDEGGGDYVRQFTREYDDYWWCTGFKAGRLRRQEPADELRLTARITFKDEKMAALFSDGLEVCGFGEGADKASPGLDQYVREGGDVYLKWQNISEAENTMPIKISVGVLAVINALSFFAFILSILAFAGVALILPLLFI